MVVHGDQNGEARNADQNRENGEEETVLEAVRNVGDEHAEAESRSPRGHGVELCLDLGVAVALNDGGAEIGWFEVSCVLHVCCRCGGGYTP